MVSKTKKQLLMKGNEAVGEGAVIAGCRHYFGYPITPQNELTAYMSRRMMDVGGTFIQSESELAAINMVLGAAAAGARTMTTSSSPGVSLMQEGISYMAGQQLPAVIVNVARGGPGLGSIGPAQSDYFQSVKSGGHGDYHCLVLAPSTAQEMMDFTILAFDLADRYRNPALVLTDGLLGQMMEPVVLREPGQSKPVDKPWALTGCKGRRPQEIKSLYLDLDMLEALNQRLQEKYARITQAERRGEHFMTDGAKILLVAYGIAARICKAVVVTARSNGKAVGLFRPISLFPYPAPGLRQAARDAKAVLVVEMSCGQMVEDVRLALENTVPVSFYGRSGGNVVVPEDVLARVEELL
jgi:2-oxoglutarate ferredoxin oxidoreductase subunit alpha